MMTQPALREFLLIDVRETVQSQAYWLDQPWIASGDREALAAAQILAAPAVDPTGAATLPNGSRKTLEGLRGVLGPDVSIGAAFGEAGEAPATREAWRFPTLVIPSKSFKAFKALQRVIGEDLERILPGHKPTDRFEMTLIIEARNQRWLQLTYAGGPKGLAQALENSVPHFLGALEYDPAKATA